MSPELLVPAGQRPHRWWLEIFAEPPLACVGGQLVASADARVGVQSVTVAVAVAAGTPAVRRSTPTFAAPKNVGKKNATTALTQALAEAVSLWARRARLIRHSLATAAPAAAPATAPATAPAAPALATAAAAAPATATPAVRESFGADAAVRSRPLPMLLQPLADSGVAALGAADFAPPGVIVQRKMDGLRLVARLLDPAAALTEANLELYSRRGLPYAGLPAVRRGLLALYARAPPAARRWFLDGEAFARDARLQEISGQVRRGTGELPLEFWIFDLFDPAEPGLPAEARQAGLDRLFRDGPVAGLVRVPTEYVVAATAAAGLEQLQARARAFVAEGFEGLVARRHGAQYQFGENNYHTPLALKIKPEYDDEFAVVGFTHGRRGRDADAIIWIVETPEGRPFNVVPMLPNEARKKLLTCMRDPANFAVIRGQKLTVRYMSRSADNVPLHARGVAFRTYEDGPDRDVVRALFLRCGL